MGSSPWRRAAAFPRFAALLAIGLSLLPSAIQGAVWEARATPVHDLQRRAVHGLSPVVTAAAELRDLMVMAKRAAQGTDTCGFVDGNANEMVTCNGRSSCTFSMNGLGCCNSSGCGGFVSACSDFTAIGATCSTCTNSAVTYCSSTKSAWCATYHYPGGIIDFICTNAPEILNMQFSATTTYQPQNHALPIPTVSGTPAATLPGQIPLTTPTTSPSNSSSGSIVGGLLIWQIALIAVAGFLVICSLFSCCCWRRYRRSRQVIYVQQPPIQMQPQQGYYPEQTYSQSNSQPNYQQQTYYPNK